MFQLKAEDRLRSWREFRASIELLTTKEALLQTAEFWSGAPFVPYNLDVTTPSNWPDPWTLIEENTFCDVAKCLGIVYTVMLTQHRDNLDIEFQVYVNPENGYEYNLANFAQGKYILNMIDGEVVNIKQIDKKLKMKQSYTATDLRLHTF